MSFATSSRLMSRVKRVMAKPSRSMESGQWFVAGRDMRRETRDERRAETRDKKTIDRKKDNSLLKKQKLEGS